MREQIGLQASRVAAEQCHVEELQSAAVTLQAAQEAASLSTEQLTEQLTKLRQTSRSEVDSLEASLTTAQVTTAPACLSLMVDIALHAFCQPCMMAMSLILKSLCY